VKYPHYYNWQKEINNLVTQFNSYLLTCKLNNRENDYKSKNHIYSESNNNNNSIQLFIIYVPSQQIQGQKENNNNNNNGIKTLYKCEYYDSMADSTYELQLDTAVNTTMDYRPHVFLWNIKTGEV
jgi:hypothetical protein